jgi:hypothetical protein
VYTLCSLTLCKDRKQYIHICIYNMYIHTQMNVEVNNAAVQSTNAVRAVSVMNCGYMTVRARSSEHLPALINLRNQKTNAL